MGAHLSRRGLPTRTFFKIALMLASNEQCRKQPALFQIRAVFLGRSCGGWGLVAPDPLLGEVWRGLFGIDGRHIVAEFVFVGVEVELRVRTDRLATVRD